MQSGIDWTGKSGGSKGFDIIGGNAPKKGQSSAGFQDSGMGFEIPLGAKVESSKQKEMGEKSAGDPELVLAELAFSNPMEMPKIIERNLPYLDATFYNCEFVLWPLGSEV